MDSTWSNQRAFLRKLSAWEVVSEMLVKAERADVLTICSFAMAEAFARRLLRERSKIGRLVVILDYTIARRHRSTLLFLHQVADEIYLCNTHAKMILIESADYTAAALMSANATMNYRYECGYVTAQPNDIADIKEQLQQMKADAVRSRFD